MKKYIVKVTKSGREWKSFNEGMDFLDDNKLYRLEWELDSFWKLVRGYWGIAFKRPHKLYKTEEGARLKR